MKAFLNTLGFKWNLYSVHYPILAAIDISLVVVSGLGFVVWMTN